MIQYTFFVWLPSLNVMFSRLIHVVAYIKLSFLFIAEQYSIVWIYHILFICSSAGGQLGCFLLLAIVDNALRNTSVQVSVQVSAFSTFHISPEVESGGLVESKQDG